ncbi:hypothetical protein SAMN02745752_00005 [Marinospirillum alkaliphilum DSM 21637]|uniref:Membrane-anchored ribosome-binding protein, inhibits growth in stationary phase, ElaB/YqjD/DUF883 family n=2 Tax=Marinospirillum TaxID=64968 RepID=A0A1K1TAW4_9GAMM|nr:hypothetical protein SAMN02745752_00005 [Marinospirillum alkaliphilum DSM 21637]
MSKPSNSEHTTTDQLSESAHQSVDQIARSAGKVEERIRHNAADAEEYVKDAGHKTKKYSDKTLESVSAYVQDNPLICLGLAFAAGSLLSALKHRS